MAFDHAFDRLRKIERSANELEHTARAHSVRIQREISILMSALQEIRRAIADVRTEIETHSGQKDFYEHTVNPLVDKAVFGDPVAHARGAGIL